jgi:hypothetical protein
MTDTNLILTINALLAQLAHAASTNSAAGIAVTQIPSWGSYATSFNALLLGGGFMLRHVVGWWLTSGGWVGIKQKFLHGNQPTTTIPKP